MPVQRSYLAGNKIISERGMFCNWTLSDHRDSIHMRCSFLLYTMPVNCCRLTRQFIHYIHDNPISKAHLNHERNTLIPFQTHVATIFPHSFVRSRNTQTQWLIIMCSTLLHEDLIMAQSDKKLPVFYETAVFITVWSRTRNWDQF